MDKSPKDKDLDVLNIENPLKSMDTPELGKKNNKVFDNAPLRFSNFS